MQVRRANVEDRAGAAWPRETFETLCARLAKLVLHNNRPNGCKLTVGWAQSAHDL
jgi:hypothetical protein